jgi:hypothetical protein
MEVFEIGQFAASFMDKLNEDFGDDIEIRQLALVAEVDGEDFTTILTACDDDRPWVQVAFVEEALASLEDRRDAMRDSLLGEDDSSDASD